MRPDRGDRKEAILRVEFPVLEIWYGRPPREEVSEEDVPTGHDELYPNKKKVPEFPIFWATTSMSGVDTVIGLAPGGCSAKIEKLSGMAL